MSEQEPRFNSYVRNGNEIVIECANTPENWNEILKWQERQNRYPHKTSGRKRWQNKWNFK